jgi:hypothetical protein
LHNIYALSVQQHNVFVMVAQSSLCQCLSDPYNDRAMRVCAKERVTRVDTEQPLICPTKHITAMPERMIHSSSGNGFSGYDAVARAEVSDDLAVVYTVVPT